MDEACRCERHLGSTEARQSKLIVFTDGRAVFLDEHHEFWLIIDADGSRIAVVLLEMRGEQRVVFEKAFSVFTSVGKNDGDRLTFELGQRSLLVSLGCVERQLEHRLPR